MSWLPPKKVLVSVVEHQRVNLPPQLDTRRIWERLADAAACAGMSEAFEVRRRGLWAGTAVGVVDCGQIAVELLPKVDTHAEAAGSRRFLHELIRFVGRDRRDFAAATAGIAEGDGALHEVLYAWAVRAVASNLDGGMPRRYVPLTETSIAVRGRVDMKGVALARPGRAFELTVRHAPLVADNEFGQAIRWLIRGIGARTQRADTRAIAIRVLGDLAGIRDAVPGADSLRRFSLGPLEAQWRPVLAFTISLAEQRQRDPTSAGELSAVGILFTLHDLFEGAVRRVFSDHGQDSGISAYRIPRHLLISTAGTPDLGLLKPDFAFRILSPAGEKIVVGDAKWKQIGLERSRPDPSRGDLYQLSAYMAAARADSGFLIAPLMHDAPAPIMASRYQVAGDGRPVTIIGVHVPTLIKQDGEGESLRGELCGVLRNGAGANPSITGSEHQRLAERR